MENYFKWTDDNKNINYIKLIEDELGNKTFYELNFTDKSMIVLSSKINSGAIDEYYRDIHVFSSTENEFKQKLGELINLKEQIKCQVI
jgi:hypothetical protein